MNKYLKIVKRASLTIGLLVFGFALYAQTQPQAHEQSQADLDMIKQANNPLASIKTVNLHNYYSTKLYGAPDASTNIAWIRYAQPIGRFIVRASLPIMTTSFASADGTTTSPTSGLYDLNAFVIYKLTKSESTDVGIGPAITFPTGTNDLGSGKWQLGLSAIAFFKSNPVVQFGTLLTWQASVAGDSDKSNVNLLTPQIFVLWQIGGGTYLRSTGIWQFDLENGTYNVPIGLGIGKVLKAGGKVFNIFMEPQYSIFAHGAGQPQLQVFVGFNTQFH